MRGSTSRFPYDDSHDLRPVFVRESADRRRNPYLDLVYRQICPDGAGTDGASGASHDVGGGSGFSNSGECFARRLRPDRRDFFVEMRAMAGSGFEGVWQMHHLRRRESGESSRVIAFVFVAGCQKIAVIDLVPDASRRGSRTVYGSDGYYLRASAS
ncbi:unnamed protein product [Parascedosporium putredinis]|uniref:Uncharacterized protein n=1 Tax=Parascedosporium putredinis TaxID=1442378 RepID=A0A9P1M9X6_9PEZI|nr:unnamed protein product [Parascedosporium putredinis]CAI7992935.1 unnamed protein product [Parascedosporium putredinis]